MLDEQPVGSSDGRRHRVALRLMRTVLAHHRQKVISNDQCLSIARLQEVDCHRSSNKPALVEPAESLSGALGCWTALALPLAGAGRDFRNTP